MYLADQSRSDPAHLVQVAVMAPPLTGKREKVISMSIVCFICLSLYRVERYTTKETKSLFKHRPHMQRKSRAQGLYEKRLADQNLLAACEYWVVGRYCDIWERL